MSTNGLNRTLALLLAGGLCGCTGESHPTPADAGNGAALVTFNTGLATGFVELAAERAQPVADAVAGIDADLVCLQEVWQEQDVQTVLATTRSTFPFQFRVDTRQAQVAAGTQPGDGAANSPDGGAAAACGQSELSPLLDCVSAECAVPVDQLANCALSKCQSQFGALTQGCQSCLIANVGQSASALASICTSGAGGQFAFEGENGVILLSRTPLTDTSSTILESTSNRRVILFARTDLPGIGTTQIACTHLTANLADVPYTGTFGSWVAEQSAQIDQLASLSKQKAGGLPLAVMGDLNTGPAVPPTIQAEVPANYQKLVDAGFADPYVALSGPPPLCTFCEGDTLTPPGTPDVIIDHVLTRALTGVSATRILTTPVAVEVNGAPTQTNLSDHYAIEVGLAK